MAMSARRHSNPQNTANATTSPMEWRKAALVVVVTVVFWNYRRVAHMNHHIRTAKRVHQCRPRRKRVLRQMLDCLDIQSKSSPHPTVMKRRGGILGGVNCSGQIMIPDISNDGFGRRGSRFCRRLSSTVFLCTRHSVSIRRFGICALRAFAEVDVARALALASERVEAHAAAVASVVRLSQARSVRYMPAGLARHQSGNYAQSDRSL